MSASITHLPVGRAPVARPFRFGSESASGELGEWSVRWLLKRNCSITPRQLMLMYATLCVVSLAIAAGFWVQGAPLVLPFAGLELLGVGAALLLYARHAADRECIDLRAGRLTVERVSGRRVERVEFAPAWVRVEPEHGDRSLIELSGQGRGIFVGRFVRPELRRQLADELRWALRRWQRGVASREAPEAVAPRDNSEN